MARRTNRDLHSPTVFPLPAFSDTVDLTTSLRGVDVLAAGTLKVTDIEGNDVTYTFYDLHDGATPGPVTMFPYRLLLQIKRIWDTGSSLTNTNVIGLH